MALQDRDKKEKLSLGKFFNKNFGGDEKGDKLPAYIFKGVMENVTLRQNSIARAFAGMGAMSVGVLMATVAVENKLDNAIDWSPDHIQMQSHQDGDQYVSYDITRQVDGKSHTYSYALYETEYGPVLLRARDDNPHDDIFYPVQDSAEAASVSAEILTRLNQLHAEQGHVDGVQNFVNVYDGVSEVFSYEANPEVTYVIGDNVSNAPSLSATELAQQRTLFDRATDIFMHGDDIAALIPSASGSHPDDDYDDLKILFAVWGVVLGSGAAIGGGQSVAASRRRYNDEKQKYKL